MRFDEGGDFVAKPLQMRIDTVPQSPGYATADIDMTCTGRFASIDWYGLVAADGVLRVKNVRTLSSANDLLIIPFTLCVAYPITSDGFSVYIGDEEATVVVNHVPSADNNFSIKGWTFVGIAYLFQTHPGVNYDPAPGAPPRQQDIDFVFHGELGLFGPGPSCVGVGLQALRVRNADRNVGEPVVEKVLGAATQGRDVEVITGAHQLGAGLTVTTYGRKFENELGSDPFEIIFDIILVLLPIALNAFVGAVMQAAQTVMDVSVQALEQVMPDMIDAKPLLIEARSALDGTPNIATAITKITSAKNKISILQGLAVQSNIINALNALNLETPDVDTAKTELDTGIASLAADIASNQEMIDRYHTGDLNLPPAAQIDATLGLQNIAIPTSVYYEPLGAEGTNEFTFDTPGRSQSFFAGDPVIPMGITYGVDVQLHTHWATTNAVQRRVAASWAVDPMRGATVTFPILTRTVETLKELPVAPEIAEDGPFFASATPSVDSSGITAPIEGTPFSIFTNSWFRSDVGEIPTDPGTVVIVWLVAPPLVTEEPENIKLFCGDRELTRFGYQFTTNGMYAYGYISGIDEVSSNEVLLCTGSAIGIVSCIISAYTGVEEIGEAHVADLNNLVTNEGVVRGASGNDWPWYLRQKMTVTADARPKIIAHAFFGKYVNFTGHLDPADHFGEYSATGREGLGRIAWGADSAIDGGCLTGDIGPYVYADDSQVAIEYHEAHLPATTLTGSSTGLAIELIGTGTAPASTTRPRPLGTGQGWINFDQIDDVGTCLHTFDITVDDDDTALVLWTFAPFVAITGYTVDGEPVEEFFNQEHSEDDFSYGLYGHIIHVDAGTHTIAAQSSTDITGLTFVLKVDAYPGMAAHGAAHSTAAQTSSALTQTVTSDQLVAQAFLCGRTPLQFKVPSYGQKARRASESYQQLTTFETFGMITGEGQDDDGSVTFTYAGASTFVSTAATFYTHTFGAAIELLASPVSIPPTITTTDLGALMDTVPFDLEIEYTGGTATSATVVSGALPSGLDLDLTMGVVTIVGTPDTADEVYSFTLRLSNAGGSDDQPFSGTVAAYTAAPVFVTTDIGDFEVGTPVDVEIVYTASPHVLTGAEISDGALPDGLSIHLDNGGMSPTYNITIDGTPTTVGDYSFELHITNAVGDAYQTFEGTITGPPAPTFVTTSLDPIYEGITYSREIEYTGDTVTAATVPAGALPTGLNLGLAAGVVTVSGTATVLDEAYDVTIRLTNAGGDTDHNFTGTVVEATVPVITTTSLELFYVGIPYTREIEYTGPPAITYNITGGALPDGITIGISDGVITVSGTPTTVDENYTVYLTLTNAVGTSDEASFSGVVVAEPVLQGAMVLNIGEVPVSIVTGDDTVVFFLYATPLDPLPEGYDPATDLILTFDGTPYTSLVTPFDMIPGIVPWPCALYVVHGIEAGVHSLGVSGAVNFSGLGVLYPGFTGHGSVSTHLPDVVTLDHTPTATSGNIVAQAYLMPVPVDPETYYPVPRVAFSSGGAGQGEAPVTFTHDLTAFLAGAGLSWEDIIGFGYQFPSIAVELTGPRDAPPVITATTIDAGGAPFTTGQTPVSPIVTSIGTDIVWSIAAGAAPSGMSFDTDRGVFYGTPDTPGSGTVTVHAHNDYGDDEVELSWTVVDP